MIHKLKSNWKRVARWLGICLIYLVPVMVVQGAFDMFLKIDGVEGESQDSKHKGWIEVMSFNHGVANPSSGATSGGAAPRSQHSDLVVVKPVDKATPKLALRCSRGDHLRDVRLEICRRTDQQIYMTYTLRDVLVSSCSVGGSAAGDDVVPTETISLRYGWIKWEYKPEAPDGSLGNAVPAEWDTILNKGK